ncbi:hypothetical protein [Streptomyces camelliae]|uniref:Uncharacterized protein n=1 Tax=Streptomyces camelliae TaxID=3004093 RepID=A0ABY7NZN1_9ACTN|nr:hypothetical protein [Streptomyces sp. HUAS 2-6]WBO61488.1 hypothetical protein O1G22_00635 [Streptomyces sp. HUAS 2-6]
MAHTQQHMHDLVEALVRTGNSFRPWPHSSGTDPFWRAKGDLVCHLEAPIDFAVAKAVPDQPADLAFVEDNDMIFCKLCWTAITGPAHHPETVSGRRR